jgi:DNA-binding FadR family transcriptional regulator
MNYVFNAEPVGGPKLSDRVVAELEARIVSGELPPGSRLPTEPELGALLHVSRTVVRDAVRTLVARGLVSVRQGHGTVVSEPTDEVYGSALITLLSRSPLTIGDVTDARAAIETQLGPLAARNGTAADWELMDDYLAGFAGAVARRDWEAAHTEHLGFHLALLEAIHLPALELLLTPMQEIIVRSSLPPSVDDPDAWDVDAHYPVLEALRRGDETATLEALRRHFRFVDDPRYTQSRSSLFRDGRTMQDVLADMRTQAPDRARRRAVVQTERGDAQ